jgi:hypothetical protein
MGRAGDESQGGAAGVQMREVASGDVIGKRRATRATLVQRLAFLPQPHEVVDDELKATLEQVQQTRFAVRTVEDVVFLDSHHRQPSTLGVQRVSRPGGGFFLGEQLLARNQPLGSRHDFWEFNVGRFHSAISFLREQPYVPASDFSVPGSLPSCSYLPFVMADRSTNRV